MKRERILIVDDEADIALILKLQMEDAGYATLRARDGMEALEVLSREKVSLMLLDIKMPRMDGVAVLEKAHKERPDVAVIMMTAHGNENIAVEAMKKGAIDYVAKPFSSDELLKKVERALDFNRTRTENLRLQREVEEERRKMEAILQGMADLLVAVDENGAVIAINRKAEDVLGITRDKAAGRRAEELLQAGKGTDRLPCLVALESQAPCLDVEYNLKTKHNTLMPVLSSATPLFNSAGKLIGSVEIIRDISVLKTLEEEREDFVSMLSHDLKSPITAVVGSIDLVRNGTLGQINQEQKEYLDAAMESCSEMVEMINTLLDVHKFEAGRMRLSYREEDPALLIQRAVNAVRPVAETGGVAISVAISKRLPHFMVDRNTFSRLMGNLLSNALKFTPQGGKIEAAAQVLSDVAPLMASIQEETYPCEMLTARGEFLKITVRDTGAGIPQEALATIFDRFVQARSRRMGKTTGTGLGLAYCRKVMDAHGGFIWAESVLGKGSTFTLLFPLKKGE